MVQILLCICHQHFFGLFSLCVKHHMTQLPFSHSQFCPQYLSNWWRFWTQLQIPLIPPPRRNTWPIMWSVGMSSSCWEALWPGVYPIYTATGFPADDQRCVNPTELVAPASLLTHSLSLCTGCVKGFLDNLDVCYVSDDDIKKCFSENVSVNFFYNQWS